VDKWRVECTKYQGFDDDDLAGFLEADSLTALKATWIRKLISRLLSSLNSNPFHFSSQSFLACLYQWPRIEEKSSQRGAEEKLLSCEDSISSSRMVSMY
jgi:hypothetical protein